MVGMHGKRVTRARGGALRGWQFAIAGCALAAASVTVRADAFSAYSLDRVFTLPSGASSFDVLADGRVVAMVNAEVYAETAIGSGTYASLGTLPGADVSPGSYATAFVRVSPDGSRIAVGNNGGASFGNYQVGVFDLGGLSGDWFSANHYEAEWIDNQYLAMTAGAFGNPSAVVALDTSSTPASPTSATLVDNIGGGTSGITFDGAGNLYTGNGFDGAGASDTGWVKAFSLTDWQPALSGGAAVDFEVSGALIVDVLSAGALGFDAEGNLHVGGSDLFGSGERDFAALVRANAVANALGGGGAAVVSDPLQVRQFDPDALNDFNFYGVDFNSVTGEFYVREGETIYSYVVPEPGTLLLLLVGAAITRRRRLGLAA
ncbi:MAG: PEP-CTERM sorting domain-containing protein [Phycisphaerales bacterium]|nr:PEP-CTERM sorting domain-containing protein [Phycisphaerales bacterium]